MTVAHLLKNKGRSVAVDQPDVPIARIASQLSRLQIGAIVITDERGHILGIVSERDVVRAIAQNGAKVLEQPVSTIMTRSVVTASEAERVHDLMRKMTEGRFRHVPIVNDGKLSGIVSIGDVVKHRLGELEAETDALRYYIRAG